MQKRASFLTMGRLARQHPNSLLDRLPLGPLGLHNFLGLLESQLQASDQIREKIAKARFGPLGNRLTFSHLKLIWIQEGFTAEPPRNDSGANFKWNDSDSGPKVRVTGRKSELQTKSRRYSPKSEPNRPEKGPNGV